MSKTINIETLYSILSTSKCIPQNGLDKVDKDLLFLFTEEPHNLQSLIDNRQDLSKGIILPSYINNNNYKKNYNNYNSQNTYSNNYSSNRDNREKDFTRGKNSQIQMSIFQV